MANRRIIVCALAIAVILGSGSMARAQASSAGTAARRPRVMLSALLHADGLSAELLARVRFHVEATNAVTLVSKKDILNSSITDHPSGPLILSDVHVIARLVRADAFVEVSAESTSAGIRAIALVGAPYPRPLRVDTLHANSALPLDSLAHRLAVQIVAATRQYRPH